MSYYMGDYYRGGFFSFLGGIAKKAVGFIPGIGPAISTALSVIPKGGAIQKVAAAAAPAVAKAGALARATGRAVVKHPVLSAAAAAGAVGGGAAALQHRGASAAMAGGGGGGRRRRINVCNPRALRRAIRRTHGFAKLAMRTIHLVHPKKKVRFGGFKKRRRKAA